MNRNEVAEFKRQHAFSNGLAGDRAACSCGWDRGSRVGSTSVARGHHKQHVANMLEAEQTAER